MDGRERPGLLDRALAALALEQWGAVAHYQLLTLGFSADAITYRIETGRLHRVHVGVYAVGYAHLNRNGRWMAAVLAYGPMAVLSHFDAAVLWELIRSSGSRIHVTADRYTRNARPGLVLHRPRRWEPEDHTVCERIPVTTVERSIIDLAALLSEERLARAWDTAVRRGLLDIKKVEAILERSNGRRGLKKVERLLTATRPILDTSRTDLERRGYMLFYNAPDLPNPQVNLWIPEVAAEIDLTWPEHRVAVELDHEEWHAKTRAQRERDNARDARLQIAGWKVLRVSDHRLRNDPEGILDDVRDLLRAQRWEGGQRRVVGRALS
jgi:hypothetical protein